MVFLHFPSGYTDEELMLKAKYAKLKKKKNALHAFQNPKSEPEKVNPLKRPLEPKEAKEYAKKLILSGKINVPIKSSGSKMVFKKPQGLVRKLSEIRAGAIVTPVRNLEGGAFQSTSGVTGVSSGVQFKPFTPSPVSTSPDPGASPYSSPYQDRKFNPGRKRFHNNYPPSSSTSEEDGQSPTPGFSRGGDETPGPVPGGMTPFKSPLRFGGPTSDFKPKQGKTVHVRGVGTLTEEICREAFNNVGSIINVSMELDRNCGFVTFDKIESAEKAIQEVNGIQVEGTTLQVSYARRQLPLSEMVGEGSSTGIAWATISANPSHKATYKDKRNAIVYDDFE